MGYLKLYVVVSLFVLISSIFAIRTQLERIEKKLEERR